MLAVSPLKRHSSAPPSRFFHDISTNRVSRLLCVSARHGGCERGQRELRPSTAARLAGSAPTSGYILCSKMVRKSRKHKVTLHISKELVEFVLQFKYIAGELLRERKEPALDSLGI